MLDPHNLWVYNSTSPATSELPSEASTNGYKPEANISTTTPLKIAANTTAVDSYVSDSFVNEKLKSTEVQLTADGNITVTSKVNISSSSTNKLVFQTSTAGAEYSGNIKINNASINVAAGVQVGAQGNITINNSKLVSEKNLTVATTKSISISESNLSGAATTVMSVQSNVDIRGGNINGKTSVRISSAITNGNTSLSGVSVNTPDVTVGGSNITLDNAILNVTPTRDTQGIKLGTETTKNVVIKNSTLNTTGSTAGVINIQGSTANSTVNANGTRT